MGHYATEHPIVETLADYLRQRLRGVEVVVSQVDTDPFYQPE
jgi:putative NIF3 family GTP cyclohydrolase 1 type 2